MDQSVIMSAASELTPAGAMDPEMATTVLPAHHSATSSQQSIDTPLALSTLVHNPDTPRHPPPPPPPHHHQYEYELGAAIGFGSTAIVHSGRHVPTGTAVAIKVFDLDRFEQQQIDRLRQELQVMSACRHDNLLSHSACITKGNELWLVMPMCSSGSIADVLKWSFPEGLEEPVLAAILHQTVQGLAHLHASGHCHRDVKAANLLLDVDGTVKLGDFGVSAGLDDTGLLNSHHSKQRRKTFVGTPCWMAPEVMEGGGYDGAKADVWSVGILALELAYGQAPFAKYPPMKVIYLTLSATTPPTLERDRCRHKYSKAVKDFVDCCLQRDADKRPSAEALLKHPLIKSVKRPAPLLVEKLVAHCPPITARNVNVLAGQLPAPPTGPPSHIEWDFDDLTEDDCTKPPKSDGNVSRRGRFTVQDAGDVVEAVGVVGVVGAGGAMGGGGAVGVGDRDVGSTIRKGRFSVECQPSCQSSCQPSPDHQPHPPAIHHSMAPSISGAVGPTINVPLAQFEQLSLLVDMLKEHVDSIASSRLGNHHVQHVLGQHRRSSTSLGNSKRESTDATHYPDRRDSLQ